MVKALLLLTALGGGIGLPIGFLIGWVGNRMRTGALTGLVAGAVCGFPGGMVADLIGPKIHRHVILFMPASTIGVAALVITCVVVKSASDGGE